MAGNNNLELEIHSLFIEGSTPDHICFEIISKYEKNDILSTLELESISHFLMALGRYDLLFKFYLNAIRKNMISTFPWGYLAAADKAQRGNISEDIMDLVDFALKNKAIDITAYQIPELLVAIPELAQREQNIRQQFEIEQLQLKTKLISQLNHNRLYQLKELEDQVISQLVKNFPTDAEVRLLHQAHLEKKADEILTRVRSQRTNSYSPAHETPTPEAVDFVEKLTTQIQKLAEHYVTTAPDQVYNLAVLCMNFELYDLSLKLLNLAPETFAGEWLKAEILFENGRFLDLLKQIETLEKKMTATPDSTLGAVYLKAQAYYGLGQKELAIQMMESLIHSRPSYRSAESLLHQWRAF